MRQLRLVNKIDGVELVLLGYPWGVHDSVDGLVSKVSSVERKEVRLAAGQNGVDPFSAADARGAISPCSMVG